MSNSNDALTNLWHKILENLKNQITKGHLLTFFRESKISNLKNGILVIASGNTFIKATLEQKYSIKLLDAAQKIDSNIKEIKQYTNY